MHKLIVILAVLAVATGAQASIIWIDAGAPDPNLGAWSPPIDPNSWLPTGGNWNNIWYSNATAQVFSNLTDTTGGNSGITLTVPKFTLGQETDGIGGAPNNLLGYPETASLDNFGVSEAQWQSLTLSGLNDALEYTITIYGNRATSAWGAPQHRKGLWRVQGSTKLQEHFGNLSNVTKFVNITPVSGQIVVDMKGFAEVNTGDPNTNIGWAYLSVMEIEIPEPATMSLLALGGLVAIRRRR